MSDTEELKGSSVPEVVGLDDSDLEDTEQGKQQPKQSLLKKLLIPAGVGLVTLVLAFAAVQYFGQADEAVPEESSEQTEASAEPKPEAEKPVKAQSWLEELEMMAQKEVLDAKGNVADPQKTTEESMTKLEAEYTLMKQQKDLSFDTSEAMAELGFLNYMQEQEQKAETASDKYSGGDTVSGFAAAGMSVQDSVDTLNWIQKEMARLNKEEKQISTLRAELEQNQKDLETRKNEIDRALARVEQVESARVASVARLYDSMKPEEVAALFENLEDKIVLAILPKMKSQNAAKILGLMPPKRAARISTKMITLLD